VKLLLDTHVLLWWFFDDPRLSEMARLPITLPHALLAGRFSVPHRDPFDRMLAAQSQLEGLPLVTSDAAFSQFDIEVLW